MNPGEKLGPYQIKEPSAQAASERCTAPSTHASIATSSSRCCRRTSPHFEDLDKSNGALRYGARIDDAATGTRPAIVVDRRAAEFVDRSSFRHVTYRQGDKPVWDKISDHCPVVIELWVQ